MTFAAWWNPFTWGIFHKADTKTEVLEKRIRELESKLGANATTTIATSTPKETATTTTATTSVVKKEVKKVPPPIDNSAIIEAQAKARVEAQLKIKADQDALIAKQKADEQARLDALKIEADKQAAQYAADVAAQKALEDAARTKKEEYLKSLKIKIAEMDQLSVQIESYKYKGPQLFEVLINAKKLSGEGLFDSVMPDHNEKNKIKNMSSAPGLYYPSIIREIKSTVNNYRAFLVVELVKNQ